MILLKRLRETHTELTTIKFSSSTKNFERTKSRYFGSYFLFRTPWNYEMVTSTSETFESNWTGVQQSTEKTAAKSLKD